MNVKLSTAEIHEDKLLAKIFGCKGELKGLIKHTHYNLYLVG
jgi:hypothetical protein